jgi:putative PEP-CTERM system histidine kinase
MEVAAYSTFAVFITAAVAYAFLVVLLLLSGRANTIKALLICVCACTAAAATAVAFGFSDILGLSGAIIELATAGSWCGFVLYLLYEQGAKKSQTFIFICLVATLTMLMSLGFAVFVPDAFHEGYISSAGTGEIYSRLGLAVIGLLATENFYRNTAPESRWHINLLCVGLAGMFVYTIAIYADALLFRRVSELLWAGRGIVLVVAAPLFAVAAARNRDWAIDIHVSRAAVFHTTTLIGSGIFLLALAASGEVFRTIGPGWGELAEITLVIGGVAAIAVMATSGSVRSRLTRILAENFFTHRYDYRQEWLKSIEILSTGLRPDTVQTRVIKAVAEIADSPGGVLWVRDLEGAAFQWAGSWNQPAVSFTQPVDSPFVALFRDGDWVVEFDRTDDRPDWLDEMGNAWLAVPLTQKGQLIGFVVLVRPRAPLKLDRESFDLLRIVARQAVIHLVEQRNAKALAESRELRDFGKRFAFVAHDLKNVTSQLAMILQNARYHRDDPEFHQDVLATVQTALDRINNLLTTLRSRQGPPTNGLIVPIDLLKQQVAAICRSRGLSIDLDHDDHSAAVAMDAEEFGSVITHLCDNAIDASDGQVQIRIRHEPMRVQIEVADRGKGMSAEFIRDRLFEPFGSTKCGGMGIGAYQARELVRAAGGDLLVLSRPGAGTTMRILLPCVGLRSEKHAVPSGLEGIR